MRILVVDDDEQTRTVLRLLLIKMGHDVFEAANGKMAVKLCQSESPDVMLTDIVMPEKEGVETIIEVHRAYPKIKIIAMTGAGRGTTYLKLATTFGASQSLMKPFSEQELSLALAKACESEA
jgi:DNA-binding NtrC family response regulator